MDGVPALPAGPDTTAGKVTGVRPVSQRRSDPPAPDDATFLLQLVMRATGGPTAQKHATVEMETAAVTL